MENQIKDPNIIHDLDTPDNKNFFSLPIFVLLIVFAVGLGIGTGYLMKNIIGSSKNGTTSSKSSTQKSAGITDKKTFKDQAEGVLKEGGVDGEGNFHLERPGGKSQNVYLTSTTADLSQFIGKKVRVWGETFQAEKAGWLMDVGSVEVLQ